MDEAGRGALRGKRIVVTRAREQSEVLALALREVGAVAAVLPLVEFAEPIERDPLDRAVGTIGEFEWILLTSQNAARAVADSAGRQGIELKAAARNVAVGCVGGVTALAAREAGLAVARVSSKPDGVSLAKELSGELESKRVLLPRSDLANPELLSVLRAQRAVVTEVIAYRTAAPPNLASDAKRVFADGNADVVLFFSPSAVANLCEVMNEAAFVKLARKAVFAAIGPVTEQALRKVGVERIVKSERQTAEGVIETLAKYFQGQPSSAGVRRG